MLPKTRDSVGVSGEQKEGIVKKSNRIKGTIDYSTDNHAERYWQTSGVYRVCE